MQWGRYQGSSSSFLRHSAGSPPAVCASWGGCVAEPSGGSCSQDRAPVVEVDALSLTGTLSF